MILCRITLSYFLLESSTLQRLSACSEFLVVGFQVSHEEREG